MTARQQELLALIAEYQRRRGGVSPSFGEMQRALGLRSKSGIHRMLDRLETDGFIRRTRHRQRAIEILRQPETPAPAVTAPGEMISIPLFKLDGHSLSPAIAPAFCMSSRAYRGPYPDRSVPTCAEWMGLEHGARC